MCVSESTETGAVTQHSLSIIRLAWTLSLKYLSEKLRLLKKKGWFLEVENLRVR